MDSKPAFEPYGIPEEVLTQCNSLIFVIGLEPTAAPSHGSVWDALTSQPKSADQPRVLYKLVQLDRLQLPPSKQMRQTYEWYTPKGVLKSNWLTKYLHEVPALVTVFYSLDWADPNWTEKRDKLLSIVSAVKEKIAGRNCRIALVLLQSTSVTAATDAAVAAASPPGADGSSGGAGGYGERASSLCVACDVPAKHLFVLPLADTALLPGYAARLSNALSDITGGFYLLLSKSVRAHRDFLNKNNHQLLFVRHNFKIGFLSEMRNDLPAAIKAYQQSYQHLSELRHTDTNLHELRVSAAIINYKVCRINFLLNLPRDAIAHFRRHIDLFRPRMGPKQLLFEHYAWLAAQYEMFGSLFERAVAQGLPAVQTQHPGFYYQQAAQFAALRRTTAHHLCAAATSSHSHLLDDWPTLEIYGQRPWRPGKHSLEPPENEREANGTEAVQHREVTAVRHSDVIIPLYSRSVAQFQRYKCPRIKQQLMVHMATEYHKAADHAKALSVLQHVLWQYRSERWWQLVAAGTPLALHCAYLTGDVAAYTATALEGMGGRLGLPQDMRDRIFDQGLSSILQGDAPQPLSPASGAEVAAATQAWHDSLLQSPVTVELSVVCPCIEVRASFSCTTAAAYTDTPVMLRLSNNFSQPLNVSKLRVSIRKEQQPQKSPNLPGKQQQQEPAEQQRQQVAELPVTVLEACNSECLVLQPGCVVTVLMPFVAEPLPPSARCYKVCGVSCCLVAAGEPERLCLQWAGAGNEGVATQGAAHHHDFSLKSGDQFSSVPVTSELTVFSREPQLDIEVSYDSAALVWEWLSVAVTVFSREQAAVEQLTLSLALQLPALPALEQTTQVCSSRAGCSSEAACAAAVKDMPLPPLPAGGLASATLFLKALTAATRRLTLTVSYVTTVSVNGREVSCPCQCTRTLAVTAKIPFQVEVGCESEGSAVSEVCAGQQFLVLPRIVSSAHVPITLTHSKLLLGAGVSGLCCGSGSVAGLSLSPGEEAHDCYSVAATTAPAHNLALGHYLLHWNRAGSMSPAVSMSVALPSVSVEVCSVTVEASLPPYTSLYSPTLITFTLTNTTAHSVECVATLEPSQYFLFAGNQQTRLRILSSQHELLQFLLYPAMCGDVPLPRLSLTVDTAATKLLPKIMLPSHIHVKPQEKLGGCSTEHRVAAAV